MSATSLTRVSYLSAYAGFLLGFGANIGLSAVGAVVGSPTLDPLEGGLFAAAFIVLAGVGWVVFFRTNRGDQA